MSGRGDRAPDSDRRVRARAIHRGSTLLMSAAMIVLGLAMVASTVARGGGPVAVGVLLGLLFVLVGAGRSYIELRRR